MSLRRGVFAAALAPALLCAALAAPQAEAVCSKPVFKDPNTFVDCKATGAEQRFRVPAGVRTVHVIAIGGGGGDGSFSVTCSGFFPTPPCTNVGAGGRGGVGAIASGDLRVTPGRTLYVLVGGRGVTQQGPAAGTGGFNGGASGGVLRLGNGFSNYLSGGGGGGGGASDVRTCNVSSRSCDPLKSRLIVAAGGGGGGGDTSGIGFGGEGGSGGRPVGSDADGSAPDGGAGGQGGHGATAKAGGGGAAAAGAGSAGIGGNGADFGDIYLQGAGGGGGGGLFGGGGGSVGAGQSTPGAGGGGGSSSGPRATRYAAAARLAPGSVRFVYLTRRIARP